MRTRAVPVARRRYRRPPTRRLVHVGCRKSSLALLARAELEEQTADGVLAMLAARLQRPQQRELPIQSQHGLVRLRGAVLNRSEEDDSIRGSYHVATLVTHSAKKVLATNGNFSGPLTTVT